ncbi:MAG: pentapeptide repeat-containing protein [Acidobacteriota bacterium]
MGNEEELELLRKENEDLRRANRAMLTGYKAGGALAALLALGPGLVKAARNYFEHTKAGEPATPRESAELFAAIVRRVTAVGGLGLAVAAVPMVLLWRQNGLIADQNEFFQEQNSKIQKQLDDQAADTLLVRKNELLRTIYETKECDVKELPKGEGQCPPLHPLRLRQEAVVALAGLVDHTNLSRANLRYAILTGAILNKVNLGGADLRQAYLFGADLNEAHFIGADLVGVYLSQAHLRGADLTDTDLTGADLRRANLSRAALSHANLRDADLSGANLWRANLRGADLEFSRNLDLDVIRNSCGDRKTKLPKNMPRPDHWLDHSWDPADDPPDGGCPPDPTSD